MSVEPMDHHGMARAAEMAVDARLQRSRDAMIVAVDELIASGAGLEQISVTDVVRRAGVSRPTFYKQFADVAELLRASAMTRMTAMFERAADAGVQASWSDFMTRTFRTLLTELVSDGRYYLTALKASPELLSHEVTLLLADRLVNYSPLGESLRSASGPVTPEQRAEFLAAGIVWQARAWLQQVTCAELSPADLESAIEQEMLILTALLFDATGINRDSTDLNAGDYR